MRINRLDILRYGALTDRSLNFREGSRLHIVYGANEAGKSSALAAVSDMLFGFPSSASMNFLHDATSLRVGAEIISRNGRSLAFRRRRGRKNTLLAASDAEEALGDDALAPMLGGLTREVFQRAFGLDSSSLRAGGEVMLKSGGEIGSLLFSAASGLMGLSQVRKSFEAEADRIYAPRRSKDRLFYQVLEAHDEARRAERENELKAGDWKKLLAERAAIDDELNEVLRGREATKRSLGGLRRLLKLDPVLREIDREREALARLEHLLALPARFAEQLEQALEASRRNADLVHEAQAEVRRLTDEIASVRVDEALISAAPRIIAAYGRSGAYVGARDDVSRVRHEVHNFDYRLWQAARRLGFADAADLEKAQPADADLVRLRQLVDDGAALGRSLEHQRQRVEEERQALRALRLDMTKGRVIDPRPWSEQLAALRPDISELASLEVIKVRAARARSELAAAAGRLDPPVTDIATLLAVPIPDIATLTRHRLSVDAARTESGNAARQVAMIEEDLKAVLRQQAELKDRGDLVSAEDIAVARNARDALIGSLADGRPGVTADEVQRLVAEADKLADAMLLDAERVARFSELGARRRSLEEALADARKMAKAADIAASDALTDFEDLFHAVPVVPGPPDKMIEWRRAVAGLMDLKTAVDEAEDALEIAEMKERAVKPILHSLAEAIGASEGELPAVALARDIERRLEELAVRWNESRSLERMSLSAEQTLARLEAAEEEVAHRWDRWSADFSDAAIRAGLPEDATMDMAHAALDVWRSVPDIIVERENRARRVRGMTRDMEAFEQEIASLCAELAPTLASLPAEVAAGMLNDRAVEARTADSRRATLAAALERAELLRQRALADADANTSELLGLASAASRPADDLPAMLHEFAERKTVEEGLRVCRRRFAEQAEGADEAAVRAELEGFDKVAAAMEIERLEAEDNRQVDRIAALRTAQAANEERRAALETGMGAEAAVFQKLAAEQEAKELARRWVVLKLAASMLTNSMEAYRERQADPIMQRAGQIFSGLTGARFSRIVQLYDEQDELQLAVVRQTGEHVPLSGLSEGTGDQLYLALRLAFLEDYCRRNEPAPFILDDIFQTFDDERTAAGIRTLASAADSFQAILFTHQMSLVEIARRELGEGLDLQILDRAG